MDEKKYVDRYDYINEWKRQNRKKVSCELDKKYYSDIYLPYITKIGMSNNEFLKKSIQYCIDNKIKF